MDNPKYVYRIVKSHNNTVDNIWIFHDPMKVAKDEELANAKRIKHRSLKFIYYILTSKVILTNDFLNTYVPIRKKQVVINTWHGGGTYKTVGLTSKNVTDFDRYFFNLHANQTTAYVSMSEAYTKNNIHNSFGFYKTVLKYGMARNSILFDKESVDACRLKILEKYGIRHDERIVLYAPTHRDYSIDGIEIIDVENCLKSLQTRYDTDFKFLFRAHHLLKGKLKSDSFIDVSDYPDMQELLAATDVLISDYSSTLWDFTLLKRPIFLFVPDLDEYEQDRDFLWPISQWPYPRARTNKELYENIIKYDYGYYMKKEEEYIEKNVSYESINSAELLADYVLSVLFEQTNRKME